jgi:hypothetical protein
MKTTLIRWGLAVLNVFFALAAILVTIFGSIPAFVLVVDEVGFWQGVYIVLALYGTLIAPFVLWRWSAEAIRSVKRALRTDAGDARDEQDAADAAAAVPPTPGTEDRV